MDEVGHYKMRKLITLRVQQASHLGHDVSVRLGPMPLSIDTELPADAVEFCPHPDASNIFVCGTYKLEDQQNDQGASRPPASQIRRGQCLVFEVHSEHSEDISVYAVSVLPVKSLLKELQLQDSGDIPSCCLGSQMVRRFPAFQVVEGWSSSQVSH